MIEPAAPARSFIDFWISYSFLTSAYVQMPFSYPTVKLPLRLDDVDNTR